MTGLSRPVPARWRHLKNWGELSQCRKVRLRWPRRDAALGKAPRNVALLSAAGGELPPTEGFLAAEPEKRPELFEWREGVVRPGRKMELAGGGVVDLPGQLAGFEGYL